MENYKVKVDRALQGSFKRKKVYVSYAPTSGPGEISSSKNGWKPPDAIVVLLHMLNLVDKLNMTERNGLNTHRIVEMLKFGFAARQVTS
jgi:gamma-glutamyltranspeptidase / glutathione hydrolase / leukotriene-C4 hydrolase